MAESAQQDIERAPLRLSGEFGPLVEVDAGGRRWLVPARLKDRLLGPDGLRLEEWLASGAATVVKTGPHRVVYRVALDDLTFFVKRHLTPDIRSRLRLWLRSNKARSEFTLARAIARRGADSVAPLALGEPASRWASGESFFLTHALEDVEPLLDFLLRLRAEPSPRRHARLRLELARCFGAWVARLHQAGIRHNDLHAGNILVRVEPAETLRLFLVDLEAVRLGPPLGKKASAANLIMLNRWFMLRASRADRFRFWRSYFQTRFPQADAPAWRRWRAFGVAIERQTLLSNLAFWRGRDRRCFKNNRYYRKLSGHGVRGYAIAEVRRPDLEKLLADPDAPFSAPGARLLKDSRSSTVVEIDLPVDGALRRVIYKRFRATHWYDPFRSLLRLTPALRSWFFGQAFCERGLPTPRPLAVFHRVKNGMLCDGYLITERIDDAENLLEFLRRMEALPAPERTPRIRTETMRMARILRAMHERGLDHRDLKAHNILVSGEPRTLSYPGLAGNIRLLPHYPSSIWIIDLVGVERYGRVRWSRRVQNLARLNVSFLRTGAISRTDRLRFLREYMRWSLHGADHWKKWWRAIERATLLKVERNDRRGRPLS